MVPMKKTTGKLAKILSLAALLTALPVFGRAEMTMSPISDTVFSLGPRATYITPKNADKGKWYAGAQARLHFALFLGVEGSIDYYRQVYAGNTRAYVYPVQASLLAYLT